MFGRRSSERMYIGQPKNPSPFILQERCFCVCIGKGKASVQDEKSLRKEINIPVQIDRKAKMDCRKKVRAGRRVFEYLVPETKKHKRYHMSVLVIRHICSKYKTNIWTSK